MKNRFTKKKAPATFEKKSIKLITRLLRLEVSVTFKYDTLPFFTTNQLII